MNTTDKNLVATVKKVRDVYGIKLSPTKAKELMIFNEVVEKNRDRKQKTFAFLLSQAVQLRNSSKYGLVEFNKLSKGTKSNFTNRFARFLGGTNERSHYKLETKQSKVFNIATWTGQVCKFRIQLDPSFNTSPQVKDVDQRIILPTRKLVAIDTDITTSNLKAEYITRMNIRTEALNN